MKRYTFSAAILAGLLLFSSCGKTTADVPDTGTASPVSPAVTETEETTAEPEKSWANEVDFGGQTLTILSQWGEWEAEDDGDVVNTALYLRKLSCEETLGLTVDVVPIELAGIADSVRKAVTAGDDSYDVINGAQYRLIPLMTEKMFADLSDAPFLSLTDAVWAQDYMLKMAVGGRVYFLTGDLSLKLLYRTSCMYFNTRLYESLTGKEKNSIYGIVRNRQWTLDTFSALIAGVYSDLNGDGIKGQGDRFGTSVMTGSITEHLALNAGVVYTKMNNGIPELISDHTRTVSVVEWMYRLYYENPDVLLLPADSNSLNVTMVNKLSSGEQLLMFGWFDTADLMRNMDADYGVLPYPMYDEKQDSYCALAHDYAGLYCVPVTVSADHYEAVCAFLQYGAEFSAENLVPAYYEIALKGKYMRDEESVQILDLIRSSVTTDFAYLFNYALNELGTITRTLMKAENSDFASFYAKNEPVYRSKIDAIIQAAEEN